MKLFERLKAHRMFGRKRQEEKLLLDLEAAALHSYINNSRSTTYYTLYEAMDTLEDKKQFIKRLKEEKKRNDVPPEIKQRFSEFNERYVKANQDLKFLRRDILQSCSDKPLFLIKDKLSQKIGRDTEETYMYFKDNMQEYKISLQKYEKFVNEMESSVNITREFLKEVESLADSYVRHDDPLEEVRQRKTLLVQERKLLKKFETTF